jgi:hypothetical protein
MERVRGRGLVVGLLVCLPAVLLGALPALGWELSGVPLGDAISSRESVDTRVRIHRGKRVRITGTVQTTLIPGVSSPIRLGFTNPNKHPVRIRQVRVTVTRVTAPFADAAHPCGAADFEVRQLRRGVLRIPAKRFTDLAGLGVPVSGWPQVVMRNRPVNQDGCKGAQLTLKYRAHRVKR